MGTATRRHRSHRPREKLVEIHGRRGVSLEHASSAVLTNLPTAGTVQAACTLIPVRNTATPPAIYGAAGGVAAASVGKLLQGKGCQIR